MAMDVLLILKFKSFSELSSSCRSGVVVVGGVGLPGEPHPLLGVHLGGCGVGLVARQLLGCGIPDLQQFRAHTHTHTHTSCYL